MKFKDLAVYLDKLENTPSRNEMTVILASLLEETSADDVEKTVNLILGQLAPNYKDIVFNMADRMIVQAIAQAFKKDEKEVNSLYKKKGDLGDVAHEFAVKNSSDHKVSVVYERLLDIAQDKGPGSQERKISKTADLLSSLDNLSVKYVARIPIGKLRLGFSDKTILDAISWMENGNKDAKKELEYAYQVMPDVGLLAANVVRYGVKKATQDAKPIVGVPVLPMLAQRLKSPKEMVKKMNKVSVEPKLDGLRILIHFKSGKNGFVKAYTRNMNETSWMFPELKDIKKHINAKEFIIDTEAVGVEKDMKKAANFQATMTRRRKHSIEDFSSKVPIKFFAFDILLKDQKNYMKETYIKRRAVLESVVKEGKLFSVVDYDITDDPETINKLNAKRKSQGHEGIMVKRVDSSYVPGRTGWRWVKMKEAEDAPGKLVDTIDCVVMGYTTGKGKRAGFGLGQFLAGVVKGESIVTVTKVGTGLTDEQIKSLEKTLRKIVITDKPKKYVIHKNYEPDYWVKPGVVIEIAADEITKSPTHTSGYALRFPRMVKVRNDKGLKQATKIEEIKNLFRMQ